MSDTDGSDSKACWLISDGKAGHESIGLGVASALERDVVVKRVAPRGLQRQFAPYWPIAKAEQVGAPGSQFTRPVPELVIAIGRQTAPYLMAIKRSAPETFTVSLLNARAGLNVADVIWAPAHDRLRGANVVTTLTSPHRFSAEYLMSLRSRVEEPSLATLPPPRIAVLLGGPSQSVQFDNDDIARFETDFSGFCATLRASGLFDGGGRPSYMITASRRTPDALLAAATVATQGDPRTIYDGGEHNPYEHFLANADALVVTGDSISMVSEAVATGRPVFVFRPRVLKSKFQHFLGALESAGAIRKLHAKAAIGDAWDSEPIDPTPQIAAAIADRFIEHQRRIARHRHRGDEPR